MRLLSAKLQATQRQFKELKKELGGEAVVQGMKLLGSKGSRLLVDMATAVSKGTLGLDR